MTAPTSRIGDDVGDTFDVAHALPLRRPWRWAAVACLAVLVAMSGNAIMTNPEFQWSIVLDYFTTGAVIQGLFTTLLLTVTSLLAGFALGTLLAIMRISGSRVLSAMSWAYTWLFRSIPLLVQILFWFNIAVLYPRLSLGIPFGTEFIQFRSVDLISAPMAAVIGLTLHEGAYAAEIVRAGFESVGRGQRQAALALGMHPRRVLWRIVVPQAMRVVIPPAGNMAIGLLKASSIISVIGVHDLLYSVELIYHRNYLIIPLLLVATIWYLITTSVLGVVQHYAESRFKRGFAVRST